MLTFMSEDVAFLRIRFLYVGVHRHKYYQMIAKKKWKIILNQQFITVIGGLQVQTVQCAPVFTKRET